MTPLRQRMTEEMQIRNLSPETQRAYLGQGASQPTPEHPDVPSARSLHRQEAAKPPCSPAARIAGHYNPHRSLLTAA